MQKLSKQRKITMIYGNIVVFHDDFLSFKEFVEKEYEKYEIDNIFLIYSPKQKTKIMSYIPIEFDNYYGEYLLNIFDFCDELLIHFYGAEIVWND